MEIDMQRENTKIEIGHYDTTWSHGQNEEHEAMLFLLQDARIWRHENKQCNLWGKKM